MSSNPSLSLSPLLGTLFCSFMLHIHVTIGTKIEIRNNNLLGEGKIDSLYLDIGRIMSNYHFSIVSIGLWELISPVREGPIFWKGGESDS